MAKKFVCTPTEPIVQTKAGKVKGFILDDTYSFRGMKYANAKRFQMPTPIEPWDGVKDATCFGYNAPLIMPETLGGDIMVPHRYWPENENCQYLNVWTRSIDKNAKKPVMVWLHGGGFFAGSGVEMLAYDGDNLSAYGDVVVVTLNHRLSILGFLDMSSYGEKYRNSGNAGMADIVEALKWVRDNIANFGGDPDNVTIFGQSGGGQKVTSVCQTPSAAGLFHKAIILSGIAFSSGSSMYAGGDRDDKPIIEGMLDELNLTAAEIEKLETLPYAQLLEVFFITVKKQNNEHASLRWGPLPNDWYLGDPMIVGFSDYAKKVPLLAGTVIAEMSSGMGAPNKNSLSEAEKKELIVKKLGDSSDKLIKLFKKAYPDKDAIELLTLDNMCRLSALKFMEEMSAVAEAPVYCYMFSLEFEHEGGRPAWHCADIPFAFHNTDRVPISNVEGVTDRLQEQFCGAFVNFAHTGNPNHAALPNWTPYSAENRATMFFDRNTELRVGVELELMELYRKVAPPFRFTLPKPEDSK